MDVAPIVVLPFISVACFVIAGLVVRERARMVRLFTNYPPTVRRLIPFAKFAPNADLLVRLIAVGVAGIGVLVLIIWLVRLIIH